MFYKNAFGFILKFLLFLAIFSVLLCLLLLLRFLLLLIIFSEENLIVDDVMSAEDPLCGHADEVHQDVAVEPHVERFWVRPLREPEKVNRDCASRDDGADDVEFQSRRDVLLAVICDEDVDRDDRVVEPDDDEHERADDAERGVGERGGRAEGDADCCEDDEEGKVELAERGALVEGVVCVGDLVSDEGERDESEVEEGDVGVYGLVEAAEGVEEDGGCHGADCGDVDAEVPEVVDGPACGEDELERVDLDAEHHEEGDEVGPDVDGLVVVLKCTLDAVAEVVPDAVPVGEEGLLHPVEVALVHGADVADGPFGDRGVFDVVEHDSHDGPAGQTDEPEEDEESYHCSFLNHSFKKRFSLFLNIICIYEIGMKLDSLRFSFLSFLILFILFYLN